MIFHFPAFTIAFVFSAALCFLSALMLWRRQVNPGSIPFALVMITLTIWSFASIFEAGAITIDGKLFWSKIQYIGIVSVAPLWLIFTSHYTGREKCISKAIRWAIWIIPVVTLLLAFTNEFHGLIWSDIILQENLGFIGYYEHGFAFFIHLIFSYSLLLLGIIWLVMDILQSEKVKRLRSTVFLISVIVGLGSNLAYNLRLFPIPAFDITPITISLIAVVMAWNISRFHLFDLIPIARDSLLSSMQDGVIVIDSNDIVLEINPAALRIMNHDGPSPLGRTVWEVFAKFQKTIEGLRERSDLTVELELPELGDKIIEVQVSSIDKDRGDMNGQLIILRDITARKQSERFEKEQKEFVEVLADTASFINQSLELDEVLERILQNVVKVVPHESANIALMTQTGQARFVKVNNPEKYGKKDYLTGLDINVMSIANFRKMAETGEPMIVPDTQRDDQWTDALEESKWIRSFLGAPIFHQGELLGFINLDASKPNAFDASHAVRLNIFTEYAATAIANARNYAEIKFYADEMAILYEISLAIAAGVGLEKTTQAVFRQLKRVIPIDLFYLALYEPVNHSVSYYMYRGSGERVEIAPFNLFQKPSMTRYVIEKKETVHIPDFTAEDAELKEQQVLLTPNFYGRTSLGIPLILRGEVIGVLSVQSEQSDAYSSRQIRLVETIAQQATIAMDNAKLFERMQELAITDGLTALYNRRYFYMLLENEIERTLRYEKPLSLIMMDIDHFKQVNDRYGHLAGDQVLESVASLSKGLLRHADIMFRYGGEEFTILLPETKADIAAKVAERIRSSIAETDFETKKGPVRISMSFGVSQFNEQLSDVNAFIESADKALFDAKQAGRNCVRIFQA
jgi:diguanylate cyclase (GGDEF)-like protein/PAS domain S-box-containing protein